MKEVQIIYIEELINNVNLEDYKIEFKGIIEEEKSEGPLCCSSKYLTLN